VTGIATSISDAIGRTPTVRLGRLAEHVGAKVVVKLESLNPGGSVKDRIGRSMLDAAEETGLITRGRSTIVESTSGNTGIALAMIGASRGYRVVITMPESMSLERRKLLRAYGAELILTPAEGGMTGATQAAREVLDRSDDAFMPSQFENPAGPLAHLETTGPELAAAVDGGISAFVTGVGTGGTVTGVGRYMKTRDREVRIVAVEPAESPVITRHLAGEELAPAPHGIHGIGPGFIPAVLDLGVVDEVLTVTTEEAIATARRLAAEEGVFAGISSGANVAAALAVAERPGFEGGTVATIACSTGERYLSTPLWEDI
jgi:cysteine synthase A